MNIFKQLICPVSGERVNENAVRITALWVVLLMGVYFITANPIIPALLAVDFYIRGFTKLKSSPLSWISKQLIKIIDVPNVLIDKGPKIFAARIGFILTLATSLFGFLGFSILSISIGSVLVVFAFLECGLNFCAGCWVYTYVVDPLVKK
jgi:hypothetical protein